MKGDGGIFRVYDYGLLFSPSITALYKSLYNKASYLLVSCLVDVLLVLLLLLWGVFFFWGGGGGGGGAVSAHCRICERFEN